MNGQRAPYDLRPMGIREIFDTAVSLYRRRFATFAAISAVVYVPYALIMAAFAAFVRSFEATLPSGGDTSFWSRLDLPHLSFGGSTSVTASVASVAPSTWGSVTTGLNYSPMSLLASKAVALVSALLFLSLVYPLCSGALVFNISAAYLGEELSAAESYRRMFGRLGRLLSAQFLVTLWVGLGVACCIIPGILASLWFMIVPAVVLLEEQSASGALTRSRVLMSGNLGKGFALGFVATVLGLVVGAATGWAISLVPWPVAFLGDFLTYLAEAVTLPVSVGITVVLYYDLRIRKEGFELAHLATKMEELSRPGTR